MYDIAIIGCGVIGAATAYALSHYEAKTVVLEAENDVADCTTKANSAILHAGYDPEPGTRMAELNVTGVAMAKEICAKLDVPCVEYGREGDGADQAKHIFRSLRALDEQGDGVVYARCPQKDGLSMAVYNRLIRAAAFRVIDL